MTDQEDLLVSTASVDEVLAAIEAFDEGAPWEDVAPRLRPALPRLRSMPPRMEPMVSCTLPPGIRVGLGLDMGPAMMFVVASQLSAWDVTEDEAFEQALGNVRERVAARRHFGAIHEFIGGIPTVAFQSREGWAASLLLLPAELHRVLGGEDGLILAPMRDLIIQLPLGTDEAFIKFLRDEFAAADMNALDLPPFTLIDGKLRKAIPVQHEARTEGPMH